MHVFMNKVSPAALNLAVVGGHVNTSLSLVSTTQLTIAKLSGFAGLFFFFKASENLKTSLIGKTIGHYREMVTYM